MAIKNDGNTKNPKIKTIPAKKGYSIPAVPDKGRGGRTTSMPPTTGRSGKKATGETPVGGRKGAGPVATVSSRIRGAEWAMRNAQHKANNRAKAAKNPTGRIAKALNAKAVTERAKTVGRSGATAPKRTATGRSGKR